MTIVECPYSHVVGVLTDADILASRLKQQFSGIKSASLQIEAALFSRILRTSTLARSACHATCTKNSFTRIEATSHCITRRR